MMTPSLDLIGGPQNEPMDDTERKRRTRMILFAVALPLAMLGGLSSTLLYRDHQSEKVQTAIIQPLLNSACQPLSKNADTYFQHGVNTPLAAYVLIKNPGQVRKLCDTINKSVQGTILPPNAKPLAMGGLDLTHQPFVAVDKNKPLADLAASFGINPRMFTSNVPTVYDRYMTVKEVARDIPDSTSSSPSMQ